MTLHWRQLVLGVEIIVLVVAAFVPEQFNDMVNAAVSFVCAMQVNSFRTFEDNPYATTMCTGNLRSGTVQLWRYFKHREKENLRSGLGYFAVILCFVSGAGIGALLTGNIGIKTVLIPAALLIVAALAMFERREEEKTE